VSGPVYNLKLDIIVIDIIATMFGKQIDVLPLNSNTSILGTPQPLADVNGLKVGKG
jgi:hypothetical protein